jgi:hypothetical protein
MALYLEIEYKYDISSYGDPNPLAGLRREISKAPGFARNRNYILSNVDEPTDFIVLDHSSVNELLLTQGADNTAYWNVWRLTPEVFRSRRGDWVVKHHFGKLDLNTLKDSIDYIFSATLDVVLSIHRTQTFYKAPVRASYYVDLNQENAPVYSKADKSSPLAGYSPVGVTRIDTDYRIDGLKGDGTYWYVSHVDGMEVLLFTTTTSSRRSIRTTWRNNRFGDACANQ